jgi:type IV fimbrial biogenesis protein FimT
MGIRGHGTGVRLDTGFTVLELLITLALVAALLVGAVPSLQQFTWRQQIRAAVGNLHNDLLLARSEAVIQNVAVVACPLSAAAGCAGTSDWSSGWIVFTDLNRDRQRQSDETILRRGQVFENLTITSNGGRTSIRFMPNGSAPGSNTTIALCGPGGPPQARKLVISNVGRIRRDSYPDVDPARCAADVN